MDQFAKDSAISTEQEEKAAKSPLFNLLEREQNALMSLDVNLSDLIHKLQPILRPQEPQNDGQTSPKDTNVSEFANQYLTNIEKAERLAEAIKEITERCDV